MKNIPIKLDKIDKKIMFELQANSRQPYSAIAKKLGLSPETVKNRTENMLRNGIVLRLFAEPNLAKLGLKTFRVYLKTTSMSGKKEAELVEKYASKPNVQWLALGEGEWDFIIRFSLKNEEEFKDELQELVNEYGEFITEKSIALGLYQSFFPLTYLAGGERTPKVRIEKTVQGLKQGRLERQLERLDKKDYQILSFLYENARMQTTEIASKLRITPEAVQYRLKKLVDRRVIDYFTASLEPCAWGYGYYKVFFWLQYLTPEKEKAIVAYCENHPNIVFIARVAGEWDLELDVHAKTPSELHEIIGEIIGKHAGIVRDHATTVILKNYLANPLKQFAAMER